MFVTRIVVLCVIIDILNDQVTPLLYNWDISDPSPTPTTFSPAFLLVPSSRLLVLSPEVPPGAPGPRCPCAVPPPLGCPRLPPLCPRLLLDPLPEDPPRPFPLLVAAAGGFGRVLQYASILRISLWVRWTLGSHRLNFSKPTSENEQQQE
jgi:hypothetical protein